MTEEYLITSDLMTNGRFMSVSLLARYLFVTMILRADQEGRATADSLSWKAQASLWGAAETSAEEIDLAIQELDAAELIVLFDDGNRFFLPGRFEHNNGRKFWKSSKHPLPPLDLLIEHPEYLDGLRCLTTKGRLYDQTSESRRYPELWADGTPADEMTVTSGELGGNQREHGGNRGESTGRLGEVCIGVGVGVGVDKDKRPASRTPPSDLDPGNQPPYSEIVTYLNEHACTRFRPSSDLTRKHINARWREGYRLDDFRKVVDIKTAEWLGTDFAKYLRPVTLFGPKFEGYLNSAPINSPPTGEAYQPYREDGHECQ